MKKTGTILSIAIGLTVTAAALLTAQNQTTAEILALREITTDHLTLVFDPAAAPPGTFEAELYNLDNQLLAKVTQNHKGKPVTVTFTAALTPAEPGKLLRPLPLQLPTGISATQHTIIKPDSRNHRSRPT